MNRIAVLIPCFNEALTIRKVVEDFRAALPQAAIYVYDNASTDGMKIIRSVFGFGGLRMLPKRRRRFPTKGNNNNG